MKTRFDIEAKVNLEIAYCTSKGLFFNKHAKNRYIFSKKKLKFQSVHTNYIDNGKMNITGLSASINRPKLERVIKVGISECGR